MVGFCHVGNLLGNRVKYHFLDRNWKKGKRTIFKNNSDCKENPEYTRQMYNQNTPTLFGPTCTREENTRNQIIIPDNYCQKGEHRRSHKSFRNDDFLVIKSQIFIFRQDYSGGRTADTIVSWISKKSAGVPKLETEVCQHRQHHNFHHNHHNLHHNDQHNHQHHNHKPSSFHLQTRRRQMPSCRGTGSPPLASSRTPTRRRPRRTSRWPSWSLLLINSNDQIIELPQLP